MPRRQIALLAVCLAAAGVRLWIRPHILDDAYITFRYSERLAAGLGFTYNDADRVLGTTSPLLALTLAAAAIVRIPLGWAALTLSIAADLVTMLLGAALLRRSGFTLVAPLLFALLIALAPMTVTSAVSGLETSVYVALLVAALWLLERDRPVLLGLTIAALALCRLDGLLMAGCCAAAILFRRSARVTYAVAAAALAPWIVFSLVYFGSLVPASVQAKAHLRFTPRASAAVVAQFFGSGLYLGLLPLSAAGAVVLARRGGLAWRTALLWWTAYMTVFTVAGAFSAFPWYFVPLLPTYFAAAAAAADTALAWLPAPRARPIVGAAGIVLSASLLGWRAARHRATIDAWSERERLYREVAERVLDRRDCALAASEIGTLGYFYPGPIVDLLGLVTPAAAGRPFAATIDAARPCWIVSYSDLLGGTVVPGIYRVRYAQPLNPSRTLLVYERR